MKRFLGVILVLVCFITPAFAEPVSQEVLNQARTQAELFMDLKNALGLEWLDEYNIYLTDPTKNPAPSWASSVDELINKNYLSVAFPTDFTIAPTGKEVTISRTITHQGIKDALPIYLPSISISGNTVSLLVQRPAQWVAWEAGLNSKISRDGEGYSDSGLDVLADTVLEFGTRTGIEFASDSKIEFINGDGKLIGIDSLEYKDQELDDRFVNVTGDTMSGSLTAPEYRISDVNTRIYKGEANSVRIQTNFGRVDIGPQDVNYAHFSTDRSKFLFDEPVHVEGRIQIYGADTYLIATEGKIDGHKILTTADEGHGKGLDADTLDGDHASSFSRVGHGHNYVSREGDTMEGTLVLPNLEVQSGGSVKFYSESGASTISTDQSGNLNLQANKVTVPSKMDVGGLKITDIYAQDVFGWKSSIDLSGSNVGIRVPDQNILLGFNDKGGITVVDTANGALLFELNRKGQLYVNRNKVWHAGNDGSGSGLDADLLDGFNSSEFVRLVYIPANADLNDYKSVGFYRNGMTVDARTMKNIPHPEAFSMVVLGGCIQIFFPYDINTSTRKFYIRYYYSSDDYWSPWSYVNLDGEQPTYDPGTNTFIDLADNPIDVSEFLSNPVLTGSSEITDETGTYRMEKYTRSFSRLPNYDITSYIRNQKLNLIKQKTGLAVVNAIRLSIEAHPKTEGNILAAGACRKLLVSRDYYVGKGLYDSIVSAKDIVGKSQDPCKQENNYNAGLYEIYTMKSSYQYGNVYIEAESEGKLLIIGVWGQY
jgi:hypothetical protein